MLHASTTTVPLASPSSSTNPSKTSRVSRCDAARKRSPPREYSNTSKIKTSSAIYQPRYASTQHLKASDSIVPRKNALAPSSKPPHPSNPNPSRVPNVKRCRANGAGGQCTKGVLASRTKLPRSLGKLRNRKGGRRVRVARRWCRGWWGVTALNVDVVSIFAICVG